MRAPYSGTDKLTYNLKGDGPQEARVVSAHLKLLDPECSSSGAGNIDRFAPTDIVEGGDTAEERAAINPNYIHVGGYYYLFVHDQAACGSKITPAQENQANDSLKALVLKLEAVPAS